MNEYLVKAIFKLKPNSQFSFTDNDYSTIKWDVLDGNAPTQSEIDAAIEQVKANEIAEADAKAAIRTSAMEKLSALGLTTEEIAALTK
jgi:hypothetical protein